MAVKGTGVSGTTIVGIVLSGLLVAVLSVLAILSVIRKFRAKKANDLRTPPADIECAILGKGVVAHGPPTERRRVQKHIRSGTVASLAASGKASSPSGSSSHPASWTESGGAYEEGTEAEYDLEEEDTEDETLTEERENKPVSFGTLHFSARYNFERNALTINVLRCEELVSRTTSKKSVDPYVKLQLLPEKQHRAKTRVLRNTNNPIYNEEFTFFGLNYNQLQGMVIHFAIISFDRYSRDEILGELLCPLSLIDLSQSDQETTLSKEICTRQKVRSQGRGEVLLSLCYQPATNRLTCVILKAKGLPRKNIMDLADPYMKLYLICNGQRIAKKKTHVKKHTLNPVFNESFVFDLPANIQGLEGVSLELMLLDFDRLTKNEVVGRLELGPNVLEETARKHWQDICSSPRKQIAEWHKLQE
ncbi:synaptotagmin-4-like isoform X2 [Paramacrobiotus metropolitanus]|uniref:synaptotagmin-4-like isoform X2 n=1 Tax=Paramacrobiotus metropolitanus TaxID=2943436 RepID=UPI002445AD9C|nr:synaptotagmin-4-like isoform X2 [Paramacrobiotus metropolitanus]